MKTALCTALRAGALLLAVTTTARAEGEFWTQDFEAAKAQARAENKDLLVDFTGSDWCIWCKRLDGEVFSSDTFRAEAPKHFVFVSLDFPRDESLITPEVKEQNERLQKEFAVQGFPTVFLLNADGVPYARTGYKEGGADSYLEHLADLKARHAKLDAGLRGAAGAEGIEKAKLLDAALDALEDRDLLLPFYEAQVEEIRTLDADGSAGLKAKYDEVVAAWKDQVEDRKLEDMVQSYAQRQAWDELTPKLDEFLAAHADRPTLRQKGLFMKGVVALQTQDYASAKTFIQSALDAAPESDVAPSIKQLLQQLSALPDHADSDDESDDDEDGDDDGGMDDGGDG